MGSSAVDSPGFLLLITMVALNTLIYVGLTLAKVIPWPKQFRPDTVRRIMRRTRMTIDEESAMAQIHMGPDEATGVFERMRTASIRTGTPRAMAFGGALVMLFAFGAWFSDLSDFAWNVASFLVGLTILAAAVVLWYGQIGAKATTWTYAVAVVAVVQYLFAAGAVNGSNAHIVYAAILATAYSPVLLDWSAALVSGAVIVLGAVVWATAYDVANIALGVVAAASIGTGLNLLHVRMRSLHERSAEIERASAIATADDLTGALSRRGLESLAPGLGNIAIRTGQPVYVASMDIVRLVDAHRAYGLAYRSALLRTTAEVLTAQVPGGDLVARWEQDEFVVLGIGRPPATDELRLGVQDGIRDSGIALGRWPVEVRVGIAAGDPAEATFVGLLTDARTARGVGTSARPQP